MQVPGRIPLKVAVFRALQLGDLICAVPALSALRAAWPRAAVTLIGLPWARAFAERYCTLIDDFLAFPGAPGFPEQAETGEGLPAFFAEARSRCFDLAIQMQGSGGVANDIVCALGARSQAGFVQPGERRSGSFIPWPETGRESERCLELIRFLGITPGKNTVNPWIPISEADRDECARLLEQCGVRAAEAAVVHAGAQLPSRRWPPERFAALGDALDRLGLRVLLTGSAAEAPLTAAVRGAMSRPAIDLAGRTSLGGLAALIEQVTLVVCNDTGVSHIAAALRTPSVVIACGSDTRRWAPADGARHRVLADHPACRPCMHRSCPFGHECALAISPARAIAAAEMQLLRHAA